MRYADKRTLIDARDAQQVQTYKKKTLTKYFYPFVSPLFSCEPQNYTP